MLKESISVDEVIAFLNELLEIDRPAIAALIANRVPCNERMLEHPTVQVQPQHGGYHVGMLGILNGLFGTFEEGRLAAWGPIMTIWDNGTLIGFKRTDSLAAEPMGE